MNLFSVWRKKSRDTCIAKIWLDVSFLDKPDLPPVSQPLKPTIQPDQTNKQVEYKIYKSQAYTYNTYNYIIIIIIIVLI